MNINYHHYDAVQTKAWMETLPGSLVTPERGATGVELDSHLEVILDHAKENLVVPNSLAVWLWLVEASQRPPG